MCDKSEENETSEIGGGLCHFPFFSAYELIICNMIGKVPCIAKLMSLMVFRDGRRRRLSAGGTRLNVQWSYECPKCKCRTNDPKVLRF